MATLMLEQLKKIKERYEPAIWLTTAVLVPVVGVIISIWKFYILPEIYSIKENVKKEIYADLSNHYDLQIESLKSLISSQRDSTNIKLDQLTHSVFDEMDSTYYLSKTYTLSPSSQGLSHANYRATPSDSSILNGDAAPAMEQLPMEQYFYVNKPDKVILYYWTNETKVGVNIRAGPERNESRFRIPKVAGL